MKRIFTLLALVITFNAAFAQAPSKMSYQAVIRNENGSLVTMQDVGMQISILQGDANGSAIYEEFHTLTTNKNGLISLAIGTGSSSDDFSSINWSEGPYFVKSETDINGGANYTISGVSELLSVPFALHAKTAESISGDVVLNEKDPEFTAWDKSAGIFITENQISDLKTYITSEVDGDVTNEIQDLILDATSNMLTITRNGTPTQIDLSKYLDNTDTKLTEAEVDAFANNNGYITSEVDGSVSNEIQDLALNATSNMLTITRNGTATDIDLTKYLDNTDTKLTEAEVDAFANNNGYISTEVDGDASNEIQDLALNATSNILTITRNGAATDIDLSKYLDNVDTNLSETEVDNFVANNGYLTSEVDGDVTNEIQDLILDATSNMLTITRNGTATQIDLNKYLDNTKLTEAEVDAFANNNGYITSEVDGDVTNEIQDLALNATSNMLTITKNGTATQIDLSKYLSENIPSAAGVDGKFVTSDGTNWVTRTVSVANAGSSQAQNNMQPFLALNYVIALDGTYPSRSSPDPFIAEIMLFGGNFAPRGWAYCDGQILEISQNATLYSLLGTTYGGNGVTTFGLPDLRGRTPIGIGTGPGLSNKMLGQIGGTETNTMTVPQMPIHKHTITIAD